MSKQIKVAVLGAGLVGGPLALDLAADSQFAVTVADIRQPALDALQKRGRLATVAADLKDANRVRQIVSACDLVVNAVPGFMGFNSLKTIIECGKNVVDIAFFPEDPDALDALAKEKGVTAITDCGVAPGMSNILIGHGARQLDVCDEATIYVGGLPEERIWPYEYKAVFSPIDVIEEYTRPARYVENGKLVVRPALSDPEFLDFPVIGTLEAFNSDGLRSLIKTINCPNMKEKTMRYPGHIEKMKVLRETGFFSKDEIEIGGVRIAPLDFTARILFPKWQLKEGERDITVMRVQVKGSVKRQPREFTWDLVDRYDETSGVHSMARTTGYTATAALRMLAQGLFTAPGVNVPEMIGKQEACVRFMLAELAKRGVVYHETVSG
jgi:lysine 6-dehydrogenase